MNYLRCTIRCCYKCVDKVPGCRDTCGRWAREYAEWEKTKAMYNADHEKQRMGFTERNGKRG